MSNADKQAPGDGVVGVGGGAELLSLQAARWQFLAVQTRSGTASAFLAASLFGALVVPSLGWGRFLVWITTLLVLFRLRDLMVTRIVARGEFSPADDFAVTWSSAGLAVLVGMPALIFFPHLDGQLQAICTTVQVCWVVAAALVLSVFWRAYLAYVVVNFLMIAGGLLLNGPLAQSGPLALLLLAPGALIVRFAKAMSTSFEDSVRMRNENAHLVQRLQQSLDEIARNQQARARFLAAASHDLLQPVHALMLLVGVLRDSPSPRAAALATSRLEATASSVASMFRGLFDQARLDAGAVDPRPTVVSLATLFKGIEATSAPRCALTGLTFEMVCEPDLRVWADAGLLDRVLRNLVDNAVKYTQHGGVQLTAVVQDAWIEIRVRDSGPGIADDDQAQIFEPFFRGDGAKQRGVDGVGLGLFIARQMTLLMGGTLSLHSACPGGTEVTLQLPRAWSQGRADDGMALMASPRHALPACKVLMVEDDRQAREAMQLWLGEQGCTVWPAGSLAEAQAVCDAQGQRPDLLMTDLRLTPGPDGLQVIAAMRQRFADLPAVLVSGDPIQAGQLPDGVRFLQKPVGADALRALLEDLLKPREV